MSKEELKNIVSEILGNSEDTTFNKFIEKIASLLEGNQSLKLNGIGHFQIKKEPLSRMERKMEGNISEKNILLFLPEGESSIISFEIDEQIDTTTEFNDSVFDVHINKPTIISEPDIEISEEKSSESEALEKTISEFVESGNIIEGYELLEGTQSTETPIVEDETRNTEEIIKNDEEFTEAEISKEFMNSDFKNDTDEVSLEDDEEYDVTSSSIEAEITDEDVTDSEMGIQKLDSELIDKNEIEAEIGSTFVSENKTEVEAEIGDEFKTKVEDEIIESNDGDVNPFDELDDYIKDETSDEAQEIIDEEPEAIEEVNEELESGSTTTTISEQDVKPSKVVKSEANEWYKNPILYIATFSLFVAIVVVYIFWTTDSETTIVDDSKSAEISHADNSKDQLGFIDSTVTSDSTIKEASNTFPEQTTDDKLADIKKVEEQKSAVTKKVIEHEVTKTKSVPNSTELYREIKNDQTVTQRVYFDGERYTVQSSSWRSTTIAEREVSKLRKRGFDAFIYKLFIASKNGTWHRVRIGYFDTQKEAEEFLKKNKI